MATHENLEYFNSLLHELCQLPNETDWVEFKHNNAEPNAIGEYISALANSAALKGKTNAYLVWGVADESHEVVGTTFRPAETKKGGELLENWLAHSLNPRIHCTFIEFDVDDKHIVMIEIPRAAHQPVQFMGIEHIRIGSCMQKLKNYPKKSRALWHVFDVTPFEQLVTTKRLDATEVLKLLNYPAYFKLLNLPLPESRDGILQQLSDDHMIEACAAGG